VKLLGPWKQLLASLQYSDGFLPRRHYLGGKKSFCSRYQVVLLELLRHLQILRCTTQGGNVAWCDLDCDPVAEFHSQFKSVTTARHVVHVDTILLRITRLEHQSVQPPAS